MIDALPFLLVAAWLVLWNWLEDREAERRRTAPERARRQRRRMEIDWLAAAGAEDYLRRTLLADLREHHARLRAKAWLRDEYGLDL